VKGHLMPWSEGDLQLLIKAVNLFPAGTNQRWEVVANFINQHSSSSSSSRRDAKEVLAKAKDLQSTDYSKSSLKEQANKKAYDNFIAEKKHKDIDERMPAFTERLENPLPNGMPACENRFELPLSISLLPSHVFLDSTFIINSSRNISLKFRNKKISQCHSFI
jgi:hypothetical protein